MTEHKVEPPECVEAEVFHRRMDRGRNKPILISARGPTGLKQCVIKLAAGLEMRTLAPLPYLCEWIAAAIAPHLGVKAAAPYEVLITHAFGQALHSADPELGRLALASLGSTYGSEFGGAAFTQLTVEMPSGELREPAATLAAFDAYIHNPDRRADNPNLLVGRNELFAFDHGDAFSFLFAIGGADPATDALLPMLDRHAVRDWLRRQRPTLDGFRGRLQGLKDELLEAIVAATPESWRQGPASGKLEQILEVLRRRRDAVDLWLPKVEAWLQK